MPDTEKKKDIFIKLSTSLRGERRRMFKSLRGAPWTVLTAIALYMNSEGKAWPSIPEIADLTGYSIRQVQRIVKQLVKMNVLHVHPEKGTGRYMHNVYSINPYIFRYGMNDSDRAAKKNLDAFRKQRETQAQHAGPTAAYLRAIGGEVEGVRIGATSQPYMRADGVLIDEHGKPVTSG
jgi:hypothetical protein